MNAAFGETRCRDVQSTAARQCEAELPNSEYKTLRKLVGAIELEPFCGREPADEIPSAVRDLVTRNLNGKMVGAIGFEPMTSTV